MTSGFNLSPVIDLLGSFSVRERTALDPPKTASVDAQKGSGTRGLGDFSAIWQYLGVGGPDFVITPISDDTDDITTDDDNDVEISTATLDQSMPLQALKSQPRIGKALKVSFTLDTSNKHKERGPDTIPQSKYSRLTRSSISNSCTTPKLSTPRKTPAKKPAATKLGDWGARSQPVIKSNVAPVDKKIVIIEKLMNLYPNTSSGLLRVRPPIQAPTDSNIHVFVDNSNILISFYEHIKKIHGYHKNTRVRRPGLSFHSLSLVLERGRNTAKRVLVGSSPVTREIIEARDMGYETSILERVEKELPVSNGASSGSETAASHKGKRKVEQAVDEILHLKILESVLDYPPSTVVLASGDGAAGEYSEGFFRMVERCLVRGWAVEIVSFEESLNGIYRQKAFRKKWKGKFNTVTLDMFAEELLE